MSSFQAIQRAFHQQCAKVSHITGVPEELVGKVIQYAKSLTRPEKPTEIDDNIFMAEHLHRFGLTNTLMIRMIFEKVIRESSKGPKQSREMALDDYILLVCTYMSSKMKLLVEHVFQVYDFDCDGRLGKPELSMMVSNPFPSDKSEDMDLDVKDLHDQILVSSDLNKDKVINFHEFTVQVAKNSLFLELLGPCLPEPEHLRMFRNLLEAMDTHETRLYFANETFRTLKYPPNYVQLKDTQFSVDLDIP